MRHHDRDLNDLVESRFLKGLQDRRRRRLMERGLQPESRSKHVLRSAKACVALHGPWKIGRWFAHLRRTVIGSRASRLSAEDWLLYTNNGTDDGMLPFMLARKELVPCLKAGLDPEICERFDDKRYMARQSFIALKLDAETTQTTASDIQLNSRLTAQWSPDPLISNEGFSLGGMSSVRGYYESEVIGDYGFALQTELRSPDLATLLGSNLVNELRFHAFLDSGYSGIHLPLPSQRPTRDQHLVSTGLGGRLKLFNHLTGAVDLGVPLTSGPDTESGDIFVRFRIQGEF